jgi:hypothetical protein
VRVSRSTSTNRDDVRIFDHGVDEGDGEDHPELRRGLEAVAGGEALVSSRSRADAIYVLGDKPARSTHNAMSSMQNRRPR